MTRRSRVLSGLIASLAMVFSLAEGTWAATCAPGAEMDGAMASAEPPMPDMPADHDCTAGHVHGEHHGGGGGMPCPFGPGGMLQGCAAAASLPAVTQTMTLLSPESAVVVPMVETSPYLLRVASIFHPPKV